MSKKHFWGKKALALLLSCTMIAPTIISASATTDLFSTQSATDVQVIRPYIFGKETVGTTLQGKYYYFDVKGGKPESGTTFQWFRADTKEGNYQPISGATEINYTLTEADTGKYIKFEVSPKSSDFDGEVRQSWMIGPVLSQEQAGTINNLFDNNNDFMANVTSIQAQIAAKMKKALYFTVDQDLLVGSEYIYVNNVKTNFKDENKPMVKDGITYAPAKFFEQFLDVVAPTGVASIQENSITYYDLKAAIAVLGKQYWNGTENQSEVASFQMEHLGQGLVVISDTEHIFDPVGDRDLIDEACNQLYTLRATDEQMDWFRDAKYGMFLHWDPSSIRGVEISWDRNAFRPGDIGSGSYNPIDPVYDTQYQQFNPTEYNPDEWMQLAKESGMKYVVLTTKHHGSFSNFLSNYDNYTIEQTPYGKDIVAQYVEAARKAGLKIGFYYSARDWYQPNYLTEDHNRYLEYYFGQVQELLSNYGKIDIMWFDSIGNSSLNKWDPRTLLRRMKQLQPELIVNNRYTANLATYDRSPYDVNGDWYTPEHRLGGFDSSRPWESCMTVTEAPGGGWSYRPGARIKSYEESLKYLINNVVNDGNLLYNIGPMPNGKLNDDHAAVFKQVGTWLDVYKESVYDTRGGPYQNPQWGGSTFKVNEDGTTTIYLHVSPLLKNFTPSGSLQIAAPSNGQKYQSATLLKNGAAVTLENNAEGILLTLPAGETWDQYDTVIQLNADVKATLESTIAQADKLLATLTDDTLSAVKQSVSAQTDLAKQAIENNVAEQFSSQLKALNEQIKRANTAVALNTSIAKATKMSQEIAVGDNVWECPQALYDSLQSSIASATGILKNANATAAEFTSFDSDLKNVLVSLENIMSALTISFNPVNGVVTNGSTFALTSSFAQLQMRYTTDGTEPTAGSPIYTKPVAIPVGVITVKAALFDQNRKVGATQSNTYLNTKVTNIVKNNVGVKESSMYNSSYTGSKACDGNSTGTRWATPDGTITAWLEIDLGSEQSFNTALIQEYGDGDEKSRIFDFNIEYWDKTINDWAIAYKGTTGGREKVMNFPAVTTSKVRLNLIGCMNPTIWEFQLYDIGDTVGITTDTTSLKPSQTAQLSVNGRFANGTVMTPDMIESVTYHTDRADIVAISDNGVVSLKDEFSADSATFHVWADLVVDGKTYTTDKLQFSAGLYTVNLALNKPASASDIYNSSFPASSAVDGNMHTRWATREAQGTYTLEVNLGGVQKFDSVKMNVYSDRGNPANHLIMKNFKIQYNVDGNWVDAYDTTKNAPDITHPVYNGTENYIGMVWVDSSGKVKSTDYVVKFDSVSSDKIRLYTNDVNNGPSIMNFAVYDTSIPKPPVNRDALNKAITDAEAITDLSIYTKESVDAFTDALAAAKAVPADADQAVVDAAAQALNTARTNLTPKPPVPEKVNKSILGFVIDYAQKAINDGKTDNLIPTVEAKFTFAFGHAKEVFADDSATQIEVDQAWALLMNAIHMLSFEKGDKTLLNTLIISSDGLILSHYTDTATFVKALADAKAVYNDQDALQSEIEIAITALNQAVNELVKIDEVKEIETVINKAEEYALDLTPFIPEGQPEFLDALDKANAILKDPNATPAEIEKANMDLLLAMLNLRYKADKDMLEKILGEAQATDENLYTPASFAAYNDARNLIEELLANPNATRDQADQAIKAMETAKQALVMKEPLETDETPSKEITADGANGTTNSATTGDSNPLATIAITMLLAGATLVFNKKRSK